MRNVYVGDFGIVAISAETLKAYGIEQFPINRRSSRQRKSLSKMERNISAIQEHSWLTGRDLAKV